jgi:hypothetical protein
MLLAPTPALKRITDSGIRHCAKSEKCHKQSSHNATFGNTALLADDNGASNWRDDNRSGDSRTRDAALRHANRLAIDDGIGRTSTHGDSDKQR